MVATAVAGASLALAAGPAGSSVTSLQQQIASEGGRAQALAQSIGGDSQAVARLGSNLQVLSDRISVVSGQLAADQAALARTVAAAGRERLLFGMLRARLERERALLARSLVRAYEQGPLDPLVVILYARGFADLVERVNYLRIAHQQDRQAIRDTRSARDAASSALVQLRRLTTSQQQTTAAVRAEQDALASMQAALAARRAALARALSLEQAALRASRARRQHLQDQLTALLAAPPAIGPAPPGTSFAIPWAIVQCESGGQNLPPNSAGASGYYQIIPSSWKPYGGSTAQAYQASKAEQDQVASRIWAGGAGASNWVCAGIVGITH